MWPTSQESAVILHLSDLQFGEHNRFTNGKRYVGEKANGVFLERILEDLEHLEKTYHLVPNIVVVTGDIAERSEPDE
jgi:3',5'-cyclic AMP phosphodiesterase CpdA